MNKLQYKSYKIGNLIISKINNDITFSYKGKNRNYSKTISESKSFSTGKKYILGIILLIFTSGMAFYIYNNFDFHSYENTFEKDEQQKNELLLSSKTDFSDQQRPVILKIREHIVQDGDTLSGLAKEYGISMDTICGSNRLHSYDIIQSGKKLKIPNKDGVLHEVMKGQTIIDIARQYKISVEKIFSENTKKNYDFISVGDMIFVPDAKPLNIIPGFLWPAQLWRITSRYGWRRNPINGERHFHEGLDIRSKYQLIRATKYGQVTYTGWMGGYGKVIIIAHQNGWKSLYGHLAGIFVKPGQYVKQGQHIGRSGDTGYSTGPHLHFELIKDGVHKDPRRYLKM